MVTCDLCGKETPLSKVTGNPCRFCSKKCSHAKWVLENPDRRRDHVRKYGRSERGQRNRDIWEAENEQILKEKKQEYYAENREEIIAANAVYQRENRESVNAYQRKWSKTDTGRKIGLQSRRRRIARELGAAGLHTTDQFYCVCAEYADHCLCCLKVFDRERLEIDHVVPLSQRGSDGVENLQPLCRKCNATKGTRTIDFRPTFWWRGPHHY